MPLTSSRAVDCTGFRVEQSYLAARGGHDLRDPAAHLPRADDEDLADLHVAETTRAP